MRIYFNAVMNSVRNGYNTTIHLTKPNDAHTAYLVQLWWYVLILIKIDNSNFVSNSADNSDSTNSANGGANVIHKGCYLCKY